MVGIEVVEVVVVTIEANSATSIKCASNVHQLSIYDKEPKIWRNINERTKKNRTHNAVLDGETIRGHTFGQTSPSGLKLALSLYIPCKNIRILADFRKQTLHSETRPRAGTGGLWTVFYVGRLD